MVRLCYDFETDGLFADTIRPDARIKRVISRVWCLVVQDLDDGNTETFYDDPSVGGEMRRGGLAEGVRFLLSADLRTGHNILGYDERVIREFFPDLWAARRMDAEVLDTQVGAEVVWPFEYLKGLDASRVKRRLTEMPGNLVGKHSLEAWGFRLGNRKDKYEGDFQTFTPDMLSYCVQDVSSTRTLFLKLEERVKAGRFSLQAWRLEQSFKHEIELQQKNGVLFDMPAAEALTARLQGRRAEIAAELVPLFPPFENHRVTPVRKEPRVDIVPFNPGSRMHIARALVERHGWRPKKYTPSGQVQIDESILEGLRKYPGVDRLIEHFVVDKRLSQLAEPAKKDAVPWMKMVREDGRIHGKVRHNAAITNRCTHARPNMTAVPRVGSPYGEECRSLFVVPRGYKMVGGDLKGIQLRGLAHYLFPIDGGAFIQEVLHGDPHEGNRIAMGLPEGKVYRDQAKTTIYAVFFGAGAGKVMQILGCSFPRAKATLELLLKNRPALAAFKRKVGRLHCTKGALNGPDGRHAFTRSAHSAIATALQLFEAVVMKQTVVLMHARFRAEGLDVKQVLSLHDEVQLEALEAHAERVATIFLESVREAGRILGSKIQLDGDVKIGNNWKETH